MLANTQGRRVWIWTGILLEFSRFCIGGAQGSSFFPLRGAHLPPLPTVFSAPKRAQGWREERPWALRWRSRLTAFLVCPQGELDRRGPVQDRPALLRVPAQLRRQLQEQPVLPR